MHGPQEGVGDALEAIGSETCFPDSRARRAGRWRGYAVGLLTFSAASAFSSSLCRLDTYKELLNWPTKKKTEKKTDIPTSFPVRFYFFFCIIGGILTKPGFALQLLVTLPGQQMARHSELRALAAQLPSPLPWEPERLVPTLGLSSSHHAWV